MLYTEHLSAAHKARAWAASDIEDGCRIYDALVGAYSTSLQIFGEDDSLFKVYFYDILKLLTQSHYKKKELDHGVQPQDRQALGQLSAWPYLGYADIVDGFDFSQKRYGKNIAIDQNLSARMGYLLARGRNAVYRRTDQPTLLVTSSIIDQRSSLWLDAPHVRVKLVKASNKWFALPDLEQQIQVVSEMIHSVVGQFAHPVSAPVLVELIARHIRANTRSGQADIALDGEVIVLKSGIELKHRMLGAVAKKRGLKVVNVMHGEAFGVYDEPHFSTLGEAAYADAILGYGSAVMESGIPYQWALGGSTEYIGSNGVRTAGMYRPEYCGVRTRKSRLSYYYFPTTLAGSSHRYGPYRDIPDSIYIEWQRELARLFGQDLTFKRHPKEKYGGGNVVAPSQGTNGTLEKLIDEIDVFVFDYVGTAFNIACATAKPVVYIDLGIRNIHPEALQAIKDRVIYFDARDGMPTKGDIDARVRFDTRANTYTQRYSLGGGGRRTHALAAGLVR